MQCIFIWRGLIAELVELLDSAEAFGLDEARLHDPLADGGIGFWAGMPPVRGSKCSSVRTTDLDEHASMPPAWIPGPRPDKRLPYAKAQFPGFWTQVCRRAKIN